MIIFCGAYLYNSFGIASNPTALLFFKFLIIFCTSSTVTLAIGVFGSVAIFVKNSSVPVVDD